MLIQEKISAADTLLELYVEVDEDLKALQPQLRTERLPCDPRGGRPILSAAEVLTILGLGRLAGGSRIRRRSIFTCGRIITGGFPPWGLQ